VLDGLHTLTVKSVQTYFDFFEQIHRIKVVGPETTQFVVLALLLDFMAFVAQKLRQHCGSEWTQDELQQGRIALQMEFNTIDAWDPSPIPKEGWALTLCGIVANSGPLTTFNDANPWECTHPVPSENSLYNDLQYSPEIYGHRPQFRRAKKLISPPPQAPSNDEPTEFDSPPAVMPASRKRARPPSSHPVMALRSPIRLPMPSATAAQIQRRSHPQSPTAYLSPSRQATSTFFPPTDDNIRSTSSSTSHPPRVDSADLKVFLHTWVSVSQVCKLGYIAVFNEKQFKVYKADTIKNALKVLDLEGKAVAYGKVENGLYYQESN
jgi:hypothetical protein